MSIEFRERPTLEHVFQLEVWKSGALIGHIRRDRGGFYQYYRAPLKRSHLCRSLGWHHKCSR